jgi:hypothetical protein
VQPFENVFQATVAECIAGVTATDAEIAAVRAALEARRATYSQRQAETCLATIESVTCAQFFNLQGPLVAACNGIFAGTIANGQSCATDIECVSQDCSDAGRCVAPR